MLELIGQECLEDDIWTNGRRRKTMENTIGQECLEDDIWTNGRRRKTMENTT